MNYYLDTEFIEGTQNKTFLGINVGETKPTIDLISIGIVAEDGREYYAISKDFNLKEAWNRFDLKINKKYPMGPEYLKEYWLRDNILKPIYQEILDKNYSFNHHEPFTYKNLESVIRNYGKSNKQIAEDIKEFCSNIVRSQNGHKASSWNNGNNYRTKEPIFYAYYADYDWVAFCWLFGKMMNLPNGFPMYCRDLKQILDEKANRIDLFELMQMAGYRKHEIDNAYEECRKNNTIPMRVPLLKKHKDYPKQTNEHNALDDARWNKKLHEFIKSL